MRIKLCALIVICCLFVAGCATTGKSGVGDGVIDDLEAATIQVTIGAAMSATPETVEPAYNISVAALAFITDDPASFAQVEEMVKKQVESLNLKPEEIQSVLDIFNLLWAWTSAEFNKIEDINKQIVYVQTLLIIVRDCAKARMDGKAKE